MGARIVIDGYNLIAALWGMGTGAGELERQRHELIGMLARYRKRRPQSIEVVFDGWREGHPLGHRTRDHGIDVSYSPKGVTADELIRDIAEERGAGLLVVSSDRTVQRWARDGGAQAVECARFVKRLIIADGEAGAGTDGDMSERERDADAAERDGWKGNTTKRGNPRKLSKKERELARRLKKL
ncbi:MAG: NYN domain-containing protein [Leptospirillia bacterium]